MIYRNKKLLEIVREFPCQHCGKQDGTVVAAHSNQLRDGKGKGDRQALESIFFNFFGIDRSTHFMVVLRLFHRNSSVRHLHRAVGENQHAPVQQHHWCLRSKSWLFHAHNCWRCGYLWYYWNLYRLSRH